MSQQLAIGRGGGDGEGREDGEDTSTPVETCQWHVLKISVAIAIQIHTKEMGQGLLAPS
jgi:hypothetical protein